MDVEEVIDEVLEIERSMRMDMAHLVVQGEEEVIQSQEVPLDVAQIVTVETEGTDESDEALTPDTLNSTDAELSPAGDGQEVTFVVQLNDEGAILLDKSGVLPEDADPHVYFPIKLPATKVKSAENPLVGAKHFPAIRSRKTKPQPVLYNDDIDQIYEMLPDGSLNSITTSRGEDITPVNEVGLGESMVSDFASRLLPKDFELMENLLANQEVLEISGPTKPTPTERKVQTVEVHNDHNYCADVPRPRPKTIITVISDGHAQPYMPPKLQMPIAKQEGDDMFLNILKPVIDPEQDPSLEEEYYGTIQEEDSKLAVRPTEGGSPGITLSEANARARRSQRQQDRVERQEAERILAENQQMLQREKELYGKGPISPSVSSNSPTAVSVPASVSLPSLGPVDKPPATPVSAKVRGKTPSSEEDPNSPRRPYPKRQNRKLPAHLADPNYVNLDESERKSQDEVAEGEDVDGEDDKEEGGEKEISEDDPNKLWCVCRKPHNNRFMICCDTCEDWFHGKCVGITKAKGSKIDKWVCPNCRKKKKSEKEMLQTPIAQVGRGGRGSSLLKSNQGKSVTKGRKLVTPGDNKEDENGKTLPTPEKSRQRKTTGEHHSPPLSTDATPTTSEKCIICKTKPSRKDSIFCSDECVVKHSHEAGSGPAVTNASPAKLKRSTSKVADKEELENFLTFHLISAGAPKSTVVVPPKPKELTASSLVKPSTPTKSTSTAESVASISSTNGKPTSSSNYEKSKSTSGKRGSESQGSGETKRTKHIESTPVTSKRSTRPTSTRSSHASASKSSTSTEGKPTRKRLSSETKEKDSKFKQKEAEKPKKEIEKQRRETEAEIAACRETSRSRLTEVFEARLKELTETERSEIPIQNTPESISLAIEAELFNSFSSVNNKYRNKFRSILFNLKDSKNNLYKTICMNELKPKELVKLEPHQLASDELAQWRINESKKELEMIKRSEIDKLEELKKQDRIDAELGFEKLSAGIVEDEARSLGTAHGDRKLDASVLGDSGTPSRASTRSSSRHKSHHHERSKSTDRGTPSRSRSQSGKVDDSKRDSPHASTSSSRKTRSSDKGMDNKSNTPTPKGTSSKDDKKGPHKSVSSSSKHSASRSSPSVQEASSLKTKDISPKEKESERNLRSRDTRSSPGNHKRSHLDKEPKIESSSRKEKRKTSRKQDDKMETKQKSGDDDKISRNSPLVAGNDDISGSTIVSGDESKAQSTITMMDTQIGVSDSNSGLRVSIDSTDQELPSSTIKTPDFTTEEINMQQLGDNVEIQKPVVESSFSMPELGSFNALLYNVSHFSLEGIFFPASPVPIVGRIPPTIVWDYIDKMKKTKEVIILRLAPATPADTEGYMTFFTYFSSRTRIGVLGGLVSPLKDVYLVPLDKHSPVNKVLLPLHGPGLPKKRAHCLLAVITRHSPDIPAPMSRRKLSSSSETPLKRMKLTSDIKPGLISSLNLTPSRDRRGLGSPSLNSKKSPEGKISPFEDTSENSQVNDDDLPYTPWEEEEGSSPASTGVNSQTLPVANKSKKVITETEPKILMHIQELEAQIQVEQAAIENMELAIIAKTHEDPLLIPGLDGEFAAEPGGVPSFLRSSTKPRGQSPDEIPKSTSEKLFSAVPSLSLLPGEGSSSSVPPGGSTELETVTEMEGEDDAPYSPSQLDLEEGTES